MKIGTLNVTVRYINFKTSGPNGRSKVNTFITVKMGDSIFATREIGGRYSQADALREFKRFPHKFAPAEGVNGEMLAAIAA